VYDSDPVRWLALGLFDGDYVYQAGLQCDFSIPLERATGGGLLDRARFSIA